MDHPQCDVKLLGLILGSLVPACIKPTVEQVDQEDRRLAASTKKVKQRFAELIEVIFFHMIFLVGLPKLQEFLLSQSIRSQLSSKDQQRILAGANGRKTITIASQSLKWYSQTFLEEVPKHFHESVTQELCSMLSEIRKMQTTYFTRSGRVLYPDGRPLLVIDSECEKLSTPEQDDLVMAALAVTGKLHSPLEPRSCNVATALAVRKSLDMYEKASEESLQSEVEEEGSKSSHTEHDTLTDLIPPYSPFVSCASPPPFKLL